MQDQVWYHIYVVMLNTVGLGFASFSETHNLDFVASLCENYNTVTAVSVQMMNKMNENKLPVGEVMWVGC